MSQPTLGELLLQLPLTDLSVQYMMDAKDLVAPQMAPVVPVQLQSGVFFEYNRDQWQRSVARPRAVGTESAGSGFALSTGTYNCVPYAVHIDIGDQEVANQINPVNLAIDGTRWVTEQLMRAREIQFFDSFYTPSANWTTKVTGGSATNYATNAVTKWSLAGSTPVADVDNYRAVVKALTGYWPNKLLLSVDTLNALKSNADILDRIKYTQKGLVTTDILAGLFEVDQVLVAAANETLSQEGAADEFGFIANSGQALLAYVAPEPGVRVPSAMYNFSWVGYTGAGAMGNQVRSFRIERLECERIEGKLAVDPQMVAGDLGVFMSSLV